MKIISNGCIYSVGILFKLLVCCEENDAVSFVICYKGFLYLCTRETDVKFTIKYFGNSRADDPDVVFYKVTLTCLMEIFFKQCNYTFLSYMATFECSSAIEHYLISRFGIYIEDKLIWYASFSQPYSLDNYGQNLTNLKYKRQYDYGFLSQDQNNSHRL